MQRKRALIVVDIQNDFLPGGALAVPSGAAVIGKADELMEGAWDAVVMTQDWHPKDHVSFAANNPGRSEGDMIMLPYGEQILWPVHCVAGTSGAAFPGRLSDRNADLIIRKGRERGIDSYSAFCAADGKTLTGLAGWLEERGITDVYVCGLATDFCVSYTAADAANAGFRTFVITDASAAIDIGGSLKAAEDTWRKLGISTVTTAEIEY